MNELFRIVNGALRLDVVKVRNYTAFLADKLEGEGDKASADRLRKMLAESDHQLHPTDVSNGRMVPVDSESRFPLLEHVNLKLQQDRPVVMAQSQWDIVNEFLSVAKSHGQMDAHGLGSSLALLLYGRPGTGKSRLARHIAKELGLNLYIARLDGLISSFLGSTSKNIRALFDFASRTPCVLFLDEFDAIAKLRGDIQELGELKRVVNSFIQNLDTLGSQSIVIAATNHESLLDAAVWRRFSYRLELTPPGAELRHTLWNQFLPPMKFSEHDMTLLTDLSEGFTGSDIQEVSLRLHRRKLTARTEPRLADAFAVLRNIAMGDNESVRFIAQLKEQTEVVIAKRLRERNARLYSHASLAQLFGVSKATAYRMSVKDLRNG